MSIKRCSHGWYFLAVIPLFKGSNHLSGAPPYAFFFCFTLFKDLVVEFVAAVFTDELAFNHFALSD
jgi:hypothetical protein